MRLPHRRIAMAFFAAAAAVAVWPAGYAGAQAPSKSGYWAQPQASALPTALPAPPAPVVPAGGLYVANAPDGPKAISALAYEVDGEVSATLVLNVHSLATPPAEAPAPPQQPPSAQAAVAHLSACVVEGDWDPPASGSGVWEHRPAYDPDNCVFGQFSTDGATVTFPLGAERQQSEGLFNLAIVPDPSYKDADNTPFSITFLPPGEESFMAGDPAPEDEEPEPEPVFDTSPPESDFDPGTFEEFSGSDETPAVFVTPTTIARRATPTTMPRVVLTPRKAQPAVALPGDERAERIMAVSLLMALAVAWWWFGGQEARGPQLLGSLAGEGRRPSRSAEPTGGIGRFARPRDRRPRPLI